MLQVTARVFDNNQLVGYQISDGQQTQLFTRQQAWVFAKNKQLLNVTATGDETNPGLSGTHGFELKRLPEIKWKEPPSVRTSQKFTFTTQDMAAAAIRHTVRTGNYITDKEAAKECLRNDVNNGVVTPQNCRTLSNSLIVENNLYDSKSKVNSITIGRQLSEEDKSNIKKLSPMYSLLRLVADIIEEAMNTKNTDIMSVNNVHSYLESGNTELVKEFRRQGGSIPKTIQGIISLKSMMKKVDTTGAPDTFRRDDLEDLQEALDMMKMAANPMGLAPAQTIIGYKVMNISSQPIPVTRMTATPDHSTSQVSLNPGQSICLNRAEMAIMSSLPEIGCTFANGKLVNSSKREAESLYEFLTRHYFRFGKMEINTEVSHRYQLASPEFYGNSTATGVDVRKLESPDIVNTYFTPVNPAQAAQQKTAQAQQTQKSIQQKGLFGAFKR